MALVHVIPAVKTECAAKRLVLPSNSLRVCPKNMHKTQTSHNEVPEQFLVKKSRTLRRGQTSLNPNRLNRDVTNMSATSFLSRG